MKIDHLNNNASDYTLCGFGSEEVLDDGSISQENTTRDLYARPKWNTNCRLCQEVVRNVLHQIKE